MSTALIIGAGSRVGQALAQTFSKAGYQVAVASRTKKLDEKYKFFSFDAAKPETVPQLFEKVTSALGTPSVVIYNAYAAGVTGEVFNKDLDAFKQAQDVNVTSAYVAAHEAVSGFEKLGAAGLGPAGGTFIYTGNLLNVGANSKFLTFGIGKTAAANMMQNLAVASYADKPYKFYYADERYENGDPPANNISGEGHAEAYLELATDPQQRKWHYTFVTGKGYKEFPREEVYVPR